MIVAAVVLVEATIVVLWFRNNHVLAFRRELIRLISVAAKADLDRVSELVASAGAGEFWRWRYEVFERVSYNRMVLTPWRPLRVESYWPDDSFIDPQARRQWVS